MTILKTFFTIVFATYIAMTQPTSAGSNISLPVSEEYADWGFKWSSGSAYNAKILITEIGGKIALCGVGYAPHNSRTITRNALRATTFTINGKVEISSLGYFAWVKTKRKLTQARANCQISNFPTSNVNSKTDFQFKSSKSRFRE